MHARQAWASDRAQAFRLLTDAVAISRYISMYRESGVAPEAQETAHALAAAPGLSAVVPSARHPPAIPIARTLVAS